jgi:hypothetical protein
MIRLVKTSPIVRRAVGAEKKVEMGSCGSYNIDLKTLYLCCRRSPEHVLRGGHTAVPPQILDFELHDVIQAANNAGMCGRTNGCL